MKKIYLLLIIFTMISCESIHYDGEKRLVFQTIVKDSNGNPMPNSNVEIYTSNSYTGDLISKGRTNQNGEITLIFPSPESIGISINLKIYSDDNAYMQKQLFNLNKEDFSNYKFILQNANLLKPDETAPLQLTYNQSAYNSIVEKVSINGIYFMDYEFYNSLQDNYNPSPPTILLKKNQAFQLKYTVLNIQTDARTEHVIDLSIGTDPLNYTINL